MEATAVPQNLQNFFKEHPRVALGFSGGVDSSYLLWAAKTCGADVCAYYVRTSFQPDFEYQDAMRIAEYVGITPTVLDVDILANETVAGNPPDRCYYCKQQIFSTIARQAEADGYPVLMDGTNADDDANERPGTRALKELQVLSPLRLCGLSKAEIRQFSKEAGLFTWNKPAYACLATRLAAGETITSEKLSRIEKAEDFMRELGFHDFRVRSCADTARIEITEDQMPLFLTMREQVQKELGENFKYVTLDLKFRAQG